MTGERLEQLEDAARKSEGILLMSSSDVLALIAEVRTARNHDKDMLEGWGDGGWDSNI